MLDKLVVHADCIKDFFFSFCHTTDPKLMILIRATKGSGENPAQLYTSGKLCANAQPIVFTM